MSKHYMGKKQKSLPLTDKFCNLWISPLHVVYFLFWSAFQESQCTGIFHLRVLELTPPPGGPCSFAGSSNNGTSSSNSKQIPSMRSASSSYNIGSCNTYVKACLSYAGSKGCQLGSFVSGLLPNNTFEGGFPLVTSFTFEQPWSVSNKT